jgi:hypothetical protein
MPTFFPTRPPHNPAARSVRRALGRSIPVLTAAAIVALAAALAAAPAQAQSLARPGWDATGVNTDPWWQHAVFYKIGPPAHSGASPSASQAFASQASAAASPADFKDIASRLDALRSLSIDALILPAPSLPTQPANTTSLPDNPTLNDLDELIRQASLRGMRILLTLPANLADPFSASRFWLSRGVAGLQIVSPPGADAQFTQAVVETLRRITGATVGQRIVLSTFNPAAASAASPSPRRAAPVRRSRPDPNAAQLQIDAPLTRISLTDASAVRALLTQSLAQPNLLLDLRRASPDPHPELSNIAAAILLTTHSAALIDATENLVLTPNAPPPAEPASPPAPAKPTPSTTFTLAVPTVAPKPPRPPDAQQLAAVALTGWFRQLSILHHGNAALRLGNPTMLNFDQQNSIAWVARPPGNSPLTPPVVVLCNLSSSTVQLAVGVALKGLNLRGNYLRTLLRSDQAMGPQDIDAVSLPPFSVYIGELHR